MNIGREKASPDDRKVVGAFLLEKMPSVSEKQRGFMCSEYGRKKKGKRGKTKMSRRQLRDFCKR